MKATTFQIGMPNLNYAIRSYIKEPYYFMKYNIGVGFIEENVGI
jgi:hypothetical protein